MKKLFSNYLAESATKAVLYEVSTSPKPGLVDRHSNGAHKDMDFFTFMSSSSAISGGFLSISEASSKFDGSNAKELLSIIRPIGVEMEKSMFKATNGVNTHKGIIFSLGIICAAAAQIGKKNNYGKIYAEEISDYTVKITEGISKELELARVKSVNTKGEEIFFKYGVKGIRGEVESGFQTVLKTGLDELRNSYYTFSSKNDLFIQTLFRIMSVCEDSNIIARHVPETLNEVQEIAKEFLDSGGMNNKNAIIKVKSLDELFIKRNISPGGSADLLAVSIMLGLLENIIN